MVVNRPERIPGGTGLIIVDVQLDFCEGGNLAIDGGAAVAKRVTRWLEANGDRYDAVAATVDWHTEHTHGHFAEDGEDPNFDTTWPVHCMADSDGSNFHPDLHLPDNAPVFYKGQTDASYSGFDGATDDGVKLADHFRVRGVNRLHVVGLAYDFCVAQTALDAVRHGFKTTVWEDLTAAVSEPTHNKATCDMSAMGVTIMRKGALATADLTL